jgi:hypothetical protein
MRQLELTELFDYDPIGGQLLWKHHRTPRARAGDPVGCLHATGYTVTLIRKKNYQVHRLIWALVHGEYPDEIDHINGIRSDNRLENLRACTRAENAKNSGTFRSNRSGYKGVSWCNREGKFQSACKVNGVKKWLGYFSDAVEAHNAYEAFASHHHGKFFPIDDRFKETTNV